MTWFSYLLRQSFPYAIISFKIPSCSFAGTSQHLRHAITLLPKISPIISFCNHLTAISPLFPQIFLVFSLFFQYLHGIIYGFPLLQFSFEMFSSCFNVSPLQVWQKKQTNKKQVAAWLILVFNCSSCPLPHLLHLPNPCVGLSCVSTEEYSQLYILAQLEVKTVSCYGNKKSAVIEARVAGFSPPDHQYIWQSVKACGYPQVIEHQQLKPGQEPLSPISWPLLAFCFPLCIKHIFFSQWW